MDAAQKSIHARHLQSIYDHLPLPLVIDDSRLTQNRQMLACCGPVTVEKAAYLAGTQLTFAMQGLYDAQPYRMRQSFENLYVFILFIALHIFHVIILPHLIIKRKPFYDYMIIRSF
jgi:hypothetical protein